MWQDEIMTELRQIREAFWSRNALALRH